MENKLREYLDNIFSTVPSSVKAVELKEEVLQNLLDKYHDLIAEGKSEQAAFNIAIASIGDINELLESVKGPMPQELSQTERQEQMAYKRRNALLTSIAVALYILSVVPCIIFDDDVIGPVLMFVFIAIATGIIIYKSMTKQTYVKKDDTMVEDFKEWKQQTNESKSLFKAVSSAIWALILVAYFTVSFTTGAWYITWLIFIIGGAIEGIVKAIFELTR